MDDKAVVWRLADFEGKYSNCFRVGSNAFELLIDFAQCGPHSRIAVLHTRIIVSPFHARTLVKLLEQTMDDLEMREGK